MHNIVRRAKTVRGRVKFRMHLSPRFDYGRAEHEVEVEKGEVRFRSKGPDELVLRLRTSVPVEVDDGTATAEFSLEEGEIADFVLDQVDTDREPPPADEEAITEALERTVDFWRAWSLRSRYRGRWREAVNRSALVLKLLQFEPAGSLVAAPTFGLPEVLGADRNWDYRYTWIRDSAFMLDALSALGYESEARSFMRWLGKHCFESKDSPRTKAPLQVLYGIDGRTDLDECELEHFSGYHRSRPVLIGNHAHEQQQLDIYGELVDAADVFDERLEPTSIDLWKGLCGIVDWVCENWTEPGAGIWEQRGKPREYLFSRVMCWVAIDRALRIARRRGLPGPEANWTRVRNEIHANILENFWNEKLGAFVGVKGKKQMDAASLLLPLVKFLSASDPRWKSHLRTLEKELVRDLLVYRTPEGMKLEEGTFSACSFWYVENLARAGRITEARLLFEKMLSYSNHLGLYAEQLGPRGEHLGNFPQALTHLALINAALTLDRVLDDCERVP